MNAPVRRALFAALLVGLGLGPGCSSEQVYDAIQDNRQQECARLPQGQYEACMRETGGTYDDYAREREELLEETRREGGDHRLSP